MQALLYSYVFQVLRKRDEQASWLLPSNAFNPDVDISKNNFSMIDDSFYFDRNTVVFALKSNNYETNNIETPYIPKPTGILLYLKFGSDKIKDFAFIRFPCLQYCGFNFRVRP